MKSEIKFRKATQDDADKIWKILRQAIERRRLDGSLQWQNGYPNPETVNSDIEKQIGYVLTENDRVVAYCAVLLNDEPAYENIEGKWLSDGDFNVVHRVAVSDEVAGKGYATEIFRRIEDFSRQNGIFSVKVDTNFDNAAMLHILKKLGYSYCGEVYPSGGVRKAFEKLI
ncbi:GNAT family N-acetyltransferase [Chryseobacterium taklimakanense]|uniref:GNAT family N-acetyltransferase n=1 Tax=Chryseobacterium taklimakanense TaxID=536441 RepID=A0A3G8WWJ4_9FLAO|nr:GNAT family N-acetyltransferase [Chryseobacterium taklimakanense]AZI20136.1 GNAT family N-acetyltransferase [Chryseobacterium taklimakanense]